MCFGAPSIQSFTPMLMLYVTRGDILTPGCLLAPGGDCTTGEQLKRNPISTMNYSSNIFLLKASLEKVVKVI